jgi:TolA-binding protein
MPAWFRPKRFLFLFLLLCNWAFAQRNVYHLVPEVRLRLGQELFANKRYAAALQVFDQTAASFDYLSESRADCDYYAALCAYELFNEDATYRFESFVSNYPENQKIKLAYFFLGNIFYRQKSYKEALEWYEQTEIYQLSKEQRFELKFKKGYCFFVRGKEKEARALFDEIKDVENKYAAPATYYFSHISYNEGNYEVALKGFQKFSKGSTFSPVVPFYISNIYFLQGKYQETIDYAIPLLDSANTKRVPEIAGLIGQSYYRLKKFETALPYLEKSMEGGAKPERYHYYQLAYCQYRAGQFERAIPNYQKVTTENDTLVQLAYYQLAACYLNVNNKQYARNSFESASKFSFDQDLAEDALFSYAKLSYELAYNPFHEAIDAFRKYIDLYPNSPRIDEAYKLLVNVYLTTKNYKEALVSIEKIKKKTLDLQFAFQRICFNRGIELYNDRDIENAILHFQKSLSEPRDKSLASDARFWIAEARYRQQKLPVAIDAYKDFLFSPGAINSEHYAQSYYSLGYCYFKTNEYKESIVWFRKLEDLKVKAENALLADATLRIADAYFQLRDYENAVSYYSKATLMKTTAHDYALFQLALVSGLSGKSVDKIASLEKLLGYYPKSDYADDAKFELGNAYLTKGENETALKYFTQVEEEYPSGGYAKKSLMKRALIYYNTNENEKAIATFKRVIELYPESQESKESVKGLREIYVEIGDVASFEDFLRSKPSIKLSPSVLDSTSYEAAERKFQKQDFESAVSDFTNYLSKFENGFFVLNAHYYRAESNFKLNRKEDALADYQWVIEKNANKFLETSLLKGSQIAFKLKKYQEAVNIYSRLELVSNNPADILDARVGKMRCALFLQQFELCQQSAIRVISMDKATNDVIMESHLAIAKSALALKNDSVAVSELSFVSQNSQGEFGAEASYLLAEMYYVAKKYELTEKSIFELIDRVPSYDYWIAKGFVLLARNYRALGDDFQAKETLKSIIEKCDIPELIKAAQEELDSILAEEKRKEEQWKQTETEIKFDTNSLQDNRLFDQDILIPEKNEGQ